MLHRLSAVVCTLIAAGLTAGDASSSPCVAATVQADEPVASAASPHAFERHALLVGCTRYPNSPNIPELWGPANDVPAFAELLTGRFGFPDQNIRRLVGWADDPATRPSCSNIVAAFENLIEKAQPNSQIVILMTGHGTQTPIPESQQTALDPANPEHDGMDEVFLPADFGGWTDSGPENAIVDDQMGQWLDQLKDRGASVWIIFDCCHSGTMTRAAQTIERHRGITPQAIGVPDSALRAAVQKIPVSAERSRSAIAGEADTLDLRTTETGIGSVTAFYAAQAFETAPELPRPSDAPRTPENYFGLLTYVLIQAFESEGQALTYRDLGRRVVGRYRSERGSRSPTPFFSGDLDREVLGYSVFPERSSIVLERVGRETRVSAGELMGISPGSILAVYPPDNRTREDGAILGHVRVTKVTPGSSDIESCEFEGRPMVALSDFPELAKCGIAWQDMGDMRLRLAIATSGDPETVELKSQISATLSGFPDEIASLVQQVDDPDQAEWVLRIVEPRESQSRYGVQIDRPTVLLMKAGADAIPNPAAELKPSASMRIVFGQYPIDDPAAMSRRIQIDLQKLFSWQNTWRIAELAARERSRGASYNVRLEVSRVDGSGIVENKSSPAQTYFVPGDDLRVRVVNEGTQDLWITLLYLDADFGISVWFSEALKAGKSFIDGGTVDGSSSGTEGFLVLAVPVRGQRSQPSYEFLEQDGVGVTTRAIRRLPTRSLNPFEQLMSAAAFGKGKHRGLRRKASSTPQILSWSWVTLPAAEKHPIHSVTD